MKGFYLFIYTLLFSGCFFNNDVDLKGKKNNPVNATVKQENDPSASEEQKNSAIISSQFSQSNSSLIWKRSSALENSIMDALDLKAEEICNELGQYNCINKVYLAEFGGNDAIEKSQYVRLEKPSFVTSIALERVALSACLKKVEKEKTVKSLFKHYDIDDKKIDYNTQKESVDKQNEYLYRRFYARDPLPEELAELGTLADGNVTTTEYATLTCFALLSSSEFLFY